MLNSKTFLFLKNLSKNNNREWFNAHKSEYELAKLDVLQFIADFIPELSQQDTTIDKELEPKKCLMRIYRDVRFSKNKDPYKLNFGIWFPTSTVKGVISPGYYLHIEPGNCFFAGGYWMPDAQHLKSIRQEIDYNGEDFSQIVLGKDFANRFRFGHGEKLKKAPKGYEVDNPNIEYLKLKSFEAVEMIDDESFLSSGIVEHLRKSIAIVYPFVVFLRNAIQ
ncbi:MAG: DUF2461 domain-containing protein [Sphingobacteriaceae bacterium]|nr:DUF2461 domain-containing protein [Sphingobacteriaceae bacterium]